MTQRPPPPGQFIDILGHKIHYERVGHGPHIVLLCPGGIGSTRSDFSVTLSTFDKDNYTMIAFDPPGHGYSRPPERDYSPGPHSYFIEADQAAELMKVSCVWSHTSRR